MPSYLCSVKNLICVLGTLWRQSSDKDTGLNVHSMLTHYYFDITTVDTGNWICLWRPSFICILFCHFKILPISFFFPLAVKVEMKGSHGYLSAFQYPLLQVCCSVCFNKLSSLCICVCLGDTKLVQKLSSKRWDIWQPSVYAINLSIFFVFGAKVMVLYGVELSNCEISF